MHQVGHLPRVLNNGMFPKILHISLKKTITRFILCNKWCILRHCDREDSWLSRVNCRTGHRRKYHTAHAHCVPDTQGYRHTLRMCKQLLLCHGNIGCANATRCLFCCGLQYIIISPILNIHKWNYTATGSALSFLSTLQEVMPRMWSISLLRSATFPA